MKQSMVILAAIVGAAVAQDLGSCAQLCINNMNLIANTEYSCPAGDQACFCSQSNWAYGVRDCSRQACDTSQAAQAIGYAQSQCQGVESTLSSGATASPSAALTILNPALSAISTGAGGSASASAASSASSALASATGSLASAASSATGAAGSAASSAASAAGSAASSAASGSAAKVTGLPVAAGLAFAAYFL